MSDPTYKLIEITGTSTESVEQAIQNAISKAALTIEKLAWFQVVETRGSIKAGRVDHLQVTLKIGFELNE